MENHRKCETTPITKKPMTINKEGDKMKEIIEYIVNKKDKSVIVNKGVFSEMIIKPKGEVFVEDILVIKGILQLNRVKGENIEKIINILKEDYRNRKGYSKKI